MHLKEDADGDVDQTYLPANDMSHFKVGCELQKLTMAHLVSNAWYGSFKLISFRNPQNCDECQTLQKIFILFLGTGLGTETQA